MGPGSPIYFDMEAYTQTSSATAATLAFLEAWTEKLHSLGYPSGVYSSSASGIADLAGQVGTGYDLPDDLWFANWNGQQNTADPYVPASAWAAHQRIHQYRGGHDETYGGVTINIDNNYVDGGTVGTRAAGAGERRPDRLPRPHRRARAGPGAGQGLGLRPQRADPTAGDPRSRRRPGRLARRARTTTSARSPAARARDVGAKYPEAGTATASTSASRPSSRGRSRSASTRSTSAPAATACSAARRPTIPVAITLSNVRATGTGSGCGSPAPGRRGPPARDSWRCAPLQGRGPAAAAAAPPRLDRSPARSAAAPSSSPASAPRLRDPAQRRRPGAAAAARQAEDPADRRDPRRAPGPRPRHRAERSLSRRAPRAGWPARRAGAASSRFEAVEPAPRPPVRPAPSGRSPRRQDRRLDLRLRRPSPRLAEQLLVALLLLARPALVAGDAAALDQAAPASPATAARSAKPCRRSLRCFSSPGVCGPRSISTASSESSASSSPSASGSRWRYLRARLPAPLASRVQPRRASRRSASLTVASS